MQLYENDEYIPCRAMGVTHNRPLLGSLQAGSRSPQLFLSGRGYRRGLALRQATCYAQAIMNNPPPHSPPKAAAAALETVPIVGRRPADVVFLTVQKHATSHVVRSDAAACWGSKHPPW